MLARPPALSKAVILKVFFWLEYHRATRGTKFAFPPSERGLRMAAQRQQTKRCVYTNFNNWSAVRTEQRELLAGEREPFWWARPSSPLCSRALFNWKQLARVSGQRCAGPDNVTHIRGTWAAPTCQTKVMFLLKLVICHGGSERKVWVLRALDGQRRKLRLWFRLHSLTMCYFYSLLLLFSAHSVIFLCKWMKWPNFTRLYCAWKLRCNLTKYCSESWLYGLPFQTQLFWLCVHCTFVCVCVCATCISLCYGACLQP